MVVHHQFCPSSSLFLFLPLLPCLLHLHSHGCSSSVLPILFTFPFPPSASLPSAPAFAWLFIISSAHPLHFSFSSLCFLAFCTCIRMVVHHQFCPSSSLFLFLPLLPCLLHL